MFCCQAKGKVKIVLLTESSIKCLSSPFHTLLIHLKSSTEGSSHVFEIWVALIEESDVIRISQCFPYLITWQNNKSAHTIYIRDVQSRNDEGKDEYQHSGPDDLKWKDVNHKESMMHNYWQYRYNHWLLFSLSTNPVQKNI